jgi:dihydrofolate synthase/folylpolyglutamate synthase
VPQHNSNTANLFSSLDEWLVYLESAHPVGIDMGLTRIHQVKESLGVQFHCPVITVGGTNGKGSTCAFLESILLRAGYQVACHTSPHILKFNERARINGLEVSNEALLKSFERVEMARYRIENAPTLTYFEFTTLAIMDLFATANVDAVILEVGMGGRLDAVNIVDADCAIVTSIDLDHMAYLGNTREAIGYEKAGIFRKNAIAICGDPMPPQSLIHHANAIAADLWLLGKDFRYEGDQQQWGWYGRAKTLGGLAYPALRGANQLLNASAAIAALVALHERLPVSAQDIRNGLALVELPGRFQVLPGKPTIILDVAHNPHAAATLAQSIESMGYHPYTYAIYGAMADKDIEGVLKPMIGVVDYWLCTHLPTERAADAQVLAQHLQTLGKEAEIYASVEAAYQSALEKAGQDDRIVIFGSFYTVAGVMAYRNNQAH